MSRLEKNINIDPSNDAEINDEKILAFARLMFPGRDFRSFLQRHRPIICSFKPLIEAVPRGSSLLDIGCGSGLMLGLLSLFGRIKDGVGFDANLNAINTASKMSIHLNIAEQITFKHVKVNQPWPVGDFNVVSMIDVMHHIPPVNRKDCLSNIAEALPIDGIFVYKDMNEKPFWYRYGNRIHDLLLAREWITYTSKNEVIAICQELGLEVIKEKFWSYFWYGHELVVFKKLK